MFVNLLEPPRQTRLVDATQMIGAKRLVEQGWDGTFAVRISTAISAR